MEKSITFVGLDVHKETIAVAVADGSGGAPRSLGTIPNRPEAVTRLMRKLGPAPSLRVCYEAGPCGYGLERQFNRLGAECMVVAPSLVPTRPGDRVKTDRRDALKLAALLRSGHLTPVWVPDEEHEALRDLVRAREDARQDLLRVRRRLSKLLLRLGVRPPEGVRPPSPWIQVYDAHPVGANSLAKTQGGAPMRRPLPNALDIDLAGGLTEEVTPHAGVALLIELGGAAG